MLTFVLKHRKTINLGRCKCKGQSVPAGLSEPNPDPNLTVTYWKPAPWKHITYVQIRVSDPIGFSWNIEITSWEAA